MKTYKFFVRSTRRGLTEWVIAYDGETEVKRIDRDVTQETVRQFRERCAEPVHPVNSINRRK